MYSRRDHYGNLTASINQINTTRIMILKMEWTRLKANRTDPERVGR